MLRAICNFDYLGNGMNLTTILDIVRCSSGNGVHVFKLKIERVKNFLCAHGIATVLIVNLRSVLDWQFYARCEDCCIYQLKL